MQMELWSPQSEGNSNCRLGLGARERERRERTRVNRDARSRLPLDPYRIESSCLDSFVNAVLGSVGTLGKPKICQST